MATIASTLLVSLLGFGASTPPLRVQVVFTGAPIAHRLEMTAMEEVAGIWGPYDVDIRAAEPNETPAADAVRIMVRLAAGDEKSVASGVLGSIPFLEDTPRPAIVMHLNVIARLVSSVVFQGLNEREWPASRRDLIVGRMLGRALAHEIGHYLLRSRQHSAAGLMRARQSTSDLIAPEREKFRLSASETSVFRLRR
jgi:hypothetical protein